MTSIFITGTDTGVGKTVVAAHLLQQLRASGLDAGYWKPVETGVPDGQPADARFVQEVAGADAPVVCTRTLPEPLAPNVAARRADQTIDISELLGTHERLAKMYRPLVVEGAGGLLVGLTDNVTMADFALEIKARILLVVANRLGCLNHALLSFREIERRGLEFGGWVLNHVSRESTAATDTNPAELERLMGPALATMAFDKPGEATLVEI